MSTLDEIDGRRFRRADIHYTLCGPQGRLAPEDKVKNWFFDVPDGRDDHDGWMELIRRIFYDTNVKLRRREPSDRAWLGMTRFEVSPVDVEAVLAWDGSTDDPHHPFPWVAAERNVVWEAGPCYLVTEDGRYDVMGYVDYTELILHRLVEAGHLDRERFVSFVDLFFRGRENAGEEIWSAREERFANIVEIRETPAFRKEPGSKPWRSGPVDPAHAR